MGPAQPSFPRPHRRAFRAKPNRPAKPALLHWVTSSTETYRLHPPRVDDAVNPIACGDGMAATIAWATRAGRNPIDAVRLGIAAAAENLRQLLPSRLDRAKVEKRAEQVRVEKRDQV